MENIIWWYNRNRNNI